MLPYLFFALFSGSSAASLAYSWPLSNFCRNSNKMIIKVSEDIRRREVGWRKMREVGEEGRRDEESGRRGGGRKRKGRIWRGRKGNETILALYSIINPRSSDLCIFVTCFPNCSTGMGGWSASFVISPGAASSFFLVPETQPRRIMLTPTMDCLNANDFYSMLQTYWSVVALTLVAFFSDFLHQGLRSVVCWTWYENKCEKGLSLSLIDISLQTEYIKTCLGNITTVYTATRTTPATQNPRSQWFRRFKSEMQSSPLVGLKFSLWDFFQSEVKNKLALVFCPSHHPFFSR